MRPYDPAFRFSLSSSLHLPTRKIQNANQARHLCLFDVENPQDPRPPPTRSVPCPHLQHRPVIIVVVYADRLADVARSKDNALLSDVGRCHLLNEFHIMLSRCVRDIDWPPTHAPARGMKPTVRMACLEHVPVREHVQMLHEQGIMCVTEHMPRMARGDIWEEVVAVAEQDAGSESRQEAVEKDLR